MFAEWSGGGQEDEAPLERSLWRGLDVALGGLLLLVALAIIIALQLAIAVVTGRSAVAGIDLPDAVVNLLFEACLGLIVLLLAARRHLTLRRLGLRRRPDGGLVASALAGAYGSIVAYQVVLSVIARFGVDVSGIDQGNALPVGSDTGIAAWIVLGIAVVAVAPVAEELLCRAFIFRAVAGVLPLWAAYLASGLVFAAFHLNLSVVVPFTFVGAFFAWAYWRSGSLWTSVIAHAIVNGVSMVITVGVR
jgi:membrane protease YdiL (CAAX protease family)